MNQTAVSFFILVKRFISYLNCFLALLVGKRKTYMVNSRDYGFYPYSVRVQRLRNRNLDWHSCPIKPIVPQFFVDFVNALWGMPKLFIRKQIKWHVKLSMLSFLLLLHFQLLLFVCHYGFRFFFFYHPIHCCWLLLYQCISLIFFNLSLSFFLPFCKLL